MNFIHNFYTKYHFTFLFRRCDLNVLRILFLYLRIVIIVHDFFFIIIINGRFKVLKIRQGKKTVTETIKQKCQTKMSVYIKVIKERNPMRFAIKRLNISAVASLFSSNISSFSFLTFCEHRKTRLSQ